MISEETLEIDWQIAFDRVKWTKLMQILKESGMD
jgi:hypothetical protein